MSNWENCTTVTAKRGINGGCVFIKYNSQTKIYYIGNSASTAVDDGGSAIQIYGVTNRQVRDMIRQLDNLGYKNLMDFKYKTGADWYGIIRDKGL